MKNLITANSKTFITFLLLLPCFCVVKAQTNGPLTLSSANTTGNYTSNTSITLASGFSSIGPFSIGIQAIDCIPLAISPSQNQNYVLTSTPRVSGFTTSTSFANRGTCELMQTVQYFDGLGKPIQTVQVKGSPSGNDVVQPMVYDQYEREVTKYLPYALTNPAASNGSYKTTAVTDQATFYNAPPAGVTANPFPVAESLLEASPLSRPLEQGAPGDNWQLTGKAGTTSPGHTIKMVYTANNSVAWATDSVNSRQVALYRITINPNANFSRTIVAGGYYQPNQLDVTITKDENWVSGRAGTMETYTDKEGHVVLKRVYNYTTSLQVLSTYYIYDDLGNLAYVLPPLANGDAAAVPSAVTLNNLCYQYRYDARNRLSQKKIPGKGWEFAVYNFIDQPVATQDSLQRNGSNWVITKYDALGRLVLTGIWSNNGVAVSQSALQGTLTAITTNLWETPTSAGNGYTNVAWPVTYVTTTLGLNYYDSYTNIPGLLSTYPLTSGVSTMLTGLLTAKKTMVLNTYADMLWDVLYYDDYGRTTGTYNQHYLGDHIGYSFNNYDFTTTTYNFTNAPSIVTRKHWTSASTSSALATIVNKYLYDHVGRKLKTWEQITHADNAPDPLNWRLISKIDYNETGQMMTKYLHSIDSVNFFQNIAYVYNERGWLQASTAPLFQMQLQYNNVNGVAGITPKAQYNGNIASQSWGTISAPNTKSYTYGYDKLNRLLSGMATDNFNEQNLVYDLQGNITRLDRYQPGGWIDQLAYTYTSGGNVTNQLQNVVDGSGSNTGLVNGTTNYTYDGNGNMLSSINTINTQQNKTLTYNLLNLPQMVAINNGTMTYTYDATGNKLRKVTVIGGVTKTTDYINGIDYDNSTSAISFIQTEEGRAFNNAGVYSYNYSLGDNLGNSRASFDIYNNTVRTLQQDDYYPFGMEISRGTVISPKNEYLYNKKELQEELQQYDYGARFYDPVIGRWNTIDPLAEKSRRFSPYNYAENNPILNIDPDGMETKGGGCCLTPPLVGTKVAKAAAKFIINTVGYLLGFIDGENSHRAFSKDPAVRAEAQKELKGYAATGAVMIMTDGLMGRVASTFGTSVTSNSVWALDASERGFAVEQMLGGHLPYGFPVIDKFENGVATSIKSIDVTADSYTKGNGLLNTLKSYVNKLEGFESGSRGNFSIEKGDITSKILEVGIQPGKATLSQWEQIGNAIKYAKDNNIQLKLQFIK